MTSAGEDKHHHTVTIPNGGETLKQKRRNILRTLRENMDRIVLIAAPLFFSPFIFFKKPELNCAYVVCVMASYWVMEVLPLAVTALIPMVAFPFFGIMKSDEVAKNFLPDTGFLFIGGLMVAVAVEKSNLHTRIALCVLATVGSNPAMILMGFMIVTCFLSMWISNTATAALMVPIVQSVIAELVQNHRISEGPSFIDRAMTRRRSIEGRRLSMTAEHANLIPQDSSNGDPLGMHTSDTPLYSHPHYQISWHRHDRHPFHHPSIDIHDQDVEMATIPEHGGTENGGKAEKTDNSEKEKMLKEVEPKTDRDPEQALKAQQEDTEEKPKKTSMRDMASLFKDLELRMAKGFLISICFSANIGGSSTITGTASNLVFMGQLEKIYPGADTGVNFLSWMVFAFLQTILAMCCCYFTLYFFFVRGTIRGSPFVTRKLKETYKSLPPVSWQEVTVFICFLILLILWITRDPKVLPGFSELFPKGYVTDATSAIFIVILLFTIPENRPSWLGGKADDSRTNRNGLLDWGLIQSQFPWAVVLLLGGGFALAAGVKSSGLSHLIGGGMQHLGGLHPYAIMTICTFITVALTNFCSNTVVASIFIPIVAELATSLDVNPLLFMLPVTVGSSFAFLLPVATPPNAIVFGSGVLTVKDMAIPGFVITIGCSILGLLNMMTIGTAIYSLDEFPDWAARPEELHRNATSLLVDILSSNLTFSFN